MLEGELQQHAVIIIMRLLYRPFAVLRPRDRERQRETTERETEERRRGETPRERKTVRATDLPIDLEKRAEREERLVQEVVCVYNK